MLETEKYYVEILLKNYEMLLERYLHDVCDNPLHTPQNIVRLRKEFVEDNEKLLCDLKEFLLGGNHE